MNNEDQTQLGQLTLDESIDNEPIDESIDTQPIYEFN